MIEAVCARQLRTLVYTNFFLKKTFSNEKLSDQSENKIIVIILRKGK